MELLTGIITIGIIIAITFLCLFLYRKDKGEDE